MVKNLFNFILLLFVSFLLAHFSAILAPFLLIIYPFLVLINPIHEPCIFCILRGHKKECAIRSLLKSEKPITIFLFDSIIIVLITLLSIGTLFLEKKLIENSSYVISLEKTAIVGVPEYGNYKITEISLIPIKISGLKTPINVVQADVSYDPILIEVQLS